MATRSRSPLVVAALAGLMLLAAAVFWRHGREFMLFSDEWTFLDERRGGGLDTWLDPHVEHLSIVPVAIYKILFATAGLDDYRPYRAVAIAAHLLCSGLVFLLIRRRFGDAAGLVGVVPILFLGYAWEDIVWAFQVGFLLSLAGGLGALLAIERDDRAGDAAAAALLTFGLASSSPAIAFVVAVGVYLAWSPGQARRLWVVGVPLVLYGIWYLAYGHSVADIDNLPSLPSYAGTAASGSVGAVTGLGLDLGRPLAAIGAVLLLRRLVTVERIPASLMAVLAGAATWWTSITLTRAMTESPTTPRYLYPGALFVVLLTVEALPHLRLRARVLVIAGVLAAVAAIGNIAPLRDAARERRQVFDQVRAELAAMEITRDRVPPDFQPTAQAQIRAGWYLDAIDDVGSSPAYNEGELGARVEPVRARADAVMLSALGVAPQPGAPAQGGPPPVADGAAGGASTTRGPCIAFTASAGSALDLTVPAAGLHIGGRGPVEVRLRRFADGWPGDATATVEAGASATLLIPPDRSARPWRARLSTSEPVTACTAG